MGEPFGDTSNVVYYVDDIVIGTSEAVVERPFVAPGRRKLFVDAFVEYRARESARPRCLPGAGPEDFGLTVAGHRRTWPRRAPWTCSGRWRRESR